MPWKGQETFVKSYKYLKTKNVKYYLAGEIFDNIYFSNISKYFNKEIIYLGFIDDIMSCIKRYKILVHASQKPEPFGRTIIEAMSLGVPVIAQNTGGQKKVLKITLQVIILIVNRQKTLPRRLIQYLKMKMRRERS